MKRRRSTIRRGAKGSLRRLFHSATVACVLLAGRPALANGRFPASNQILFSPTDPNYVITRATYGILPSHDNGATWQFICEDALGLSLLITAPYDPALGLTKNNALLAAFTTELRYGAPFLGLDLSTDMGCSWSCIGGPLAKQAVSDLVVRPDAPDVVLAVTSTQLQQDAGGGTSSQVFESTDDGSTWNPLGAPLDPGIVIQTIDVVRGDPKRIYLSGTRVIAAKKTASLLVSNDTGATWTEHPLPQFDPSNEEFIWIAAVDPVDANRIYVRSNAPVNPGGKSRLYVTTDGGNSFQMLLEFNVPPYMNYPNVATSGIGELLGFALSPDGSKVYAGSKESGLFMAAKSDLMFRHVNSAIHIECLATRGSELWACADAVSGFIVGVSTDDGAHFCPKMQQVYSLTGPIACPGTATTLGCGATVNASDCQASFDAVCAYNASTGKCATDSPASLPARCRAPSGCGCSMAGAKGVGGFFAASSFLAIWLKRASKRRRSTVR
jgi:MYXO-CTERM domain-containing protein